MANCITRHIPNAVTCCNLFSGCIASVMAFNENYTLAISFIILGAVFDFFDGMLARLFKVSGPLGKEFTLGAGYANMKYDTYYNIDNGAQIETRSRNYWGITRLGLSLSYHF